MPEYLAPGVYVEEVSFRSKSIEGVPTSTTGFVGVARYGPVQYPGGPTSTEPLLVTSYTEFERAYGGLETIYVNAATGSAPTLGDERLAYLAHAARAFFLNGGQRLYIARVFAARDPANIAADPGVASQAVAFGGTQVVWRARWPGALGNVWIEPTVKRTRNLAYVVNDPSSPFNGAVQARLAKLGAVVEVIPSGTTPPSGNTAVDPNTMAVVSYDANGQQIFTFNGGAHALNATDTVQLLEIGFDVRVTQERVDHYDGLATSPAQLRYVGTILQRDHPEDDTGVVWLDDSAVDWTSNAFLPALLLQALQGNANKKLSGGNDGSMPTPDDLLGQEADPDHADVKATGLYALADIDDIAIVAAPDSATYPNDDDIRAAAQNLVAHAELCRYRIAVVDGPDQASMNRIRAFRGFFDSKYAALYHPWVIILDPTQSPARGAPPARLALPPSGFVAGIYARSDIQRGVHKAPANEVVLGLTELEININKRRQDVLNPEGINALRFFEGRGNRVWGARTLSSDPEWKYVNVRRLFIYLEHSIDKGTQWAVFEPNNSKLWANIRRTVEDFLLVSWKDGALLGDKPEQAYFVRCDRTTMTQNDLDNGRMICLIGVAPAKPAEYVIFRIGQWTGDAQP